jgi:hypothetical protein
MKTIFAPFALAAVMLLTSACGLGTMIGSGNVITQNRGVSGFDKVVLNGTGEIILTQGDAEALTIEAEDNLMPYLETVVRNGTLEIGFRNHEFPNFLPTRPIRYNLTMKDVRGLTVSESGSIDARSLNTDQLAVEVHGSGNFDAGSLTAGELTTRIDGSGNVAVQTLTADGLTSILSGSGSAILAGNVKQQSLTISGSGKYEAGQLNSQTATIAIDGAGTGVVQVAQAMDVQISGSGSVGYYGSSRVTSSISGSGSVRQLGQGNAPEASSKF